jgi:hypothetical protein
VLLAGGAGGPGGDLHLRAVRGATPLESRISVVNGVVAGASTQTLEAVQVYEDGDGVIDANDVATYLNDAAAFMSAPPDLGPTHRAARHRLRAGRSRADDAHRPAHPALWRAGRRPPLRAGGI